MLKPLSLVIAALLLQVPGSAEDHASSSQVLSARPLLLGSPAAAREWDAFAGKIPDAHRLDLRFNASVNSGEATLLIRQDDVKQVWGVELNGRRLGALFLMEADLVQAIRIPPEALRDGENLLSIVPPTDNDDIVLQEIRLDLRPLKQAVGSATLVCEVRDEADGKPLPCRLTIVDGKGTLAPLVAAAPALPTQTDSQPRSGTNLIAVRPGVIYSGDGTAQVGLPAGDYTIYASRGFEWSVATQYVRLGEGESGRLAFSLRHEVATPGWVSCDTHVHTFTHSGHGDASLEERLLTVVGEGIELPIATDHNFLADYSRPARELKLDRWFTPVTGDEVTTAMGHFNVFPVEAGSRVPDFRITDWPALMKSIRATPGVRVVVLNHPRNVHSGFQPFNVTNYNQVSGDNKRGPEFTFDAIEVMNSSAQQSDYLLVYRDWFALLNHGYRITGVGSSDGHDVSRYIVGQGRTYIACPDADSGRIDVAMACSNLLAGRALVSMGLLPQMTVDEKFRVGDVATGLGERVQVSVRVLGPSWVKATRVTLFANGAPIRDSEISPNSASLSGERGTVTWTIARPPHDVHLVAIATGPGVTAPFWAIPRPYQPTSPHWQSRVIGSTNPIWVDGDGDGRFESARDYARRLVARADRDVRTLLRDLGQFDEAVAAQAASLLAEGGHGPDGENLARALQSAAPQVQQGFGAYFGAAR